MLWRGVCNIGVCFLAVNWNLMLKLWHNVKIPIYVSIYLSGHLICRSFIYNFSKNKQIIAILNRVLWLLLPEEIIHIFIYRSCHVEQKALSLVKFAPLASDNFPNFAKIPSQFFSQTRRYAKPLCPETYSFKCLKKPLRIYHTQIVKEHFVNTLFFLFCYWNVSHTPTLYFCIHINISFFSHG